MFECTSIVPGVRGLSNYLQVSVVHNLELKLDLLQEFILERRAQHHGGWKWRLRAIQQLILQHREISTKKESYMTTFLGLLCFM